MSTTTAQSAAKTAAPMPSVRKPLMSANTVALSYVGCLAVFVAVDLATRLDTRDYDSVVVEDLWWHRFGAWMGSHWEIPILTSLLYCVGVHYGQHVMKNRAPVNLGSILVYWNFLLAGFSIVGAYNVIPIHASVIWNKGVGHDICSAREEHYTPWILFFCLSKFPELVDTCFLVLRKRPVILLHWYHHALTLVYCWAGFVADVGTGNWFAMMNLFVHSIMYSYYGIMSAKVYRVPTTISKVITTLQISQMFVGLAACMYGACCGGYDAKFLMNAAGSLMYISYAMLFIHMYRQKYSKAKKA